MREFVDAFRAQGPAARPLLLGLGQHAGDRRRNGDTTVTRAQIDYVKPAAHRAAHQLRPDSILCSTAGPGRWATVDAYKEIRALVKSIQPDCLLAGPHAPHEPWDADVAPSRSRKGAFVPADNTFPATQGQKINASGGNDWFWAPGIGGLMTVDQHRQRPPPDARAALDQLPAQLSAQPRRPDGRRDRHAPGGGRRRLEPKRVARAAARAGPAERIPVHARQRRRHQRHRRPTPIDGINDYGYYTIWQSAGVLPQSVTIDLGQSRPDVGSSATSRATSPTAAPAPTARSRSYTV